MQILISLLFTPLHEFHRLHQGASQDICICKLHRTTLKTMVYGSVEVCIQTINMKLVFNKLLFFCECEHI